MPEEELGDSVPNPSLQQCMLLLDGDSNELKYIL